MIVDFRVRPPFKSFAKLRIYNPRPQNPDPVTASPLFTNMEPYRSYEETSIDAFVEELDEAGIDVAVAMGRKAGGPHGSVPYEELVELRELFPGRFVCFGGLNGVDVEGALEDIDRCVDLGFKGAALDNGWSEPPLYDDDERLFPIYEKCTERGTDRIADLKHLCRSGCQLQHAGAYSPRGPTVSRPDDRGSACGVSLGRGDVRSGLSEAKRLPDPRHLRKCSQPSRGRRLLSCRQRFSEPSVSVRQQLSRQASRAKPAVVQVTALRLR